MSPPDPATDVTPMPQPPEDVQPTWHRLSAWMIIVRPLHALAGVFPVVLLLLITRDGDFFQIVVPAAVFVLLVLSGFVRWWRTSYRLGEEQVELHTGLVSRKRLTVRRDRIRTVELTARWGHRLCGLAEVGIGTGQDESVSLDGIRATRAEHLRRSLLNEVPERQVSATGSTAEQPVASSLRSVSATDRTLCTLDLSWLRYAPLTLSGLAWGGAIIGLAFRTFDQAELDPGDIGVLRDVVAWVKHGPVAAVVALAAGSAVVIVTLLSVANYMVRYGDYRLSRAADSSLRVRRGALTKRSLSIAPARMRGVSLGEPLLLRTGGGAKLNAIATGLDDTENETGLLLPPAPRSVARRVAAQCLLLCQSPVAAPLTPHPRYAGWRRQTRAVGPVLVLAAALGTCSVLDSTAWPNWPWIVVLALVPAASLLAFDRYRGLGHTLTRDHLVTRSGSLRRETAALQRSGIIGWKLRSSIFQRRAGLATLTATTAAGDESYEVTDIGHTDAVALADSAVPGLLEPFLLAGDETTAG